MRCWWWCPEMITENRSKGRLLTQTLRLKYQRRFSLIWCFRKEKGYWMGDKLYDWLVGWDSKWIKFGWKVSSCLIGWKGWRGGCWSDVASSSSSIAPDNTALGHYFKKHAKWYADNRDTPQRASGCPLVFSCASWPRGEPREHHLLEQQTPALTIASALLRQHQQ